MEIYEYIIIYIINKYSYITMDLLDQIAIEHLNMNCMCIWSHDHRPSFLAFFKSGQKESF